MKTITNIQIVTNSKGTFNLVSKMTVKVTSNFKYIIERTLQFVDGDKVFNETYKTTVGTESI